MSKNINNKNSNKVGNEKMNNLDCIRNILIPMGIARPMKKNKYPFVVVTVILLSIAYKILTIKYINSVVLDFIVIGLIVGGISFIYDKLYYKHCSTKFDAMKLGVIIGHSNTVLVLEGQNVIKEYDCDMIIIKPADAVKDKIFDKYSSVIECVQNNEITAQIIIDKIEEFENRVLLPNLDRVEEDLEIIYED